MSAPTAPFRGAPTDRPPTGERVPRGASDRLLRVCIAAGAILLILALALDVAVLLGAVGSPDDPGRSIGKGLQFNAVADSDLLTGFERTDYNEKAGPPEVVDSPNIQGRDAIRFSVAPDAQRSEILPKIPHQREGDVLYFGYNGYLAPDFPVDANSYQIFMQWHHEGSSYSPPISVNARDNQLVLAGGDDKEHRSYEEPIAPIRPGQPIHLVIKIAFSRDPRKASIDVWSQGQRTVTAFHPPDGTMYDVGDYLKVGMYRDTHLPGTATVYLDNLAVGTEQSGVEQAITEKPDTLPAGLVVGSASVLALAALALTVIAQRRRRRG